MTKRIRKFGLLACGIALPCLAPLMPEQTVHAEQDQQTQQPPQSQKPLKVQTTLVTIYATARDSHHALVPNLKQEDFRISEDGVEQKLAYFSKEVNLPITLGLLVDTSGSETDTLSVEQEAATRFLHEVLRPKDLAMVITFDQDVDLLADFTDDLGILERAIQRARINVPHSAGISPGPVPVPVVGTAFYDAVYLACHAQLSDQAGRKAVVILTDAYDEGSKLKAEDAIAAAQRADAVIHIILIVAPGFPSGSGVAKKMTEETGGRVLNAHNGNQLEKAFREISDELRSQYVLGYYPTNMARDGTFRKIKVEVKQSDTKVLARRGYYAPKQ